MASVDKWYVLDKNGNPMGPFSTAKLAERMGQGEVEKDCLCWTDGRETWQCAENIAELQAALGAAESKTRQAAATETDSTLAKEERFIDDDGTLYVWNPDLKKYEPREISEEYDREQMTFKGDEDATPSLDDARKQEETATAKDGQKRKEPEQKKTTAVYVTGLPLDVTAAEVAVTFSKCGVLKEDDEGNVKIKLYKHKESGLLKGDGIVTYLKSPSVELAINILGGTVFRNGAKQPMTVQEATFENKPEPRPNKKHKKLKKPKKVTREDKLLGWAGFDDHLSLRKVTVILKNMFQPRKLLGGEPSKEELKEDVKSECEKLGPVDRVVVYENHEDGVISVRFRTEEAADACIDRMHGRYYSQKRIQAHKWDGFTKYYTPKHAVPVEDEDSRLENFGRDLEKT